MRPDASTSLESRLEGEKYNARHGVWEAAHTLGSPIYTLRRSLVVELLPGKERPLYFLDVGCGTGEYSRVLVERGHRVDAIDVSESAVRQATSRIPERSRDRFHAQVGDFSLLDSKARYDGIVCSEVLEHVEDDEALLRRLHALLLSHGSLVLSVPADPSLWSHDDVFSGHVRRYTREEFVAKLRRAGFEVERFYSYGFPILRIYSWLKLRLLRGESVLWADRCGRTARGRWTSRLFALVINILVWILDRRLLCAKKGIGFVVRCRKA